MTTQTLDLTNKIIDAIDEVFDEKLNGMSVPIYGKQEFIDAIGEKLDEILNGK